MGTKGNIRKSALHVLVWVAAFFINIILIQGYSVRINWTNTLVSWVFYVFIFYVNYSLLIPRLLKWRWGFVYVVCALAVLAVSFVSIKYTAVESAQHNARHLGERLLQYPEVKQSYDEKERLRERQKEIERQRERQREMHSERQIEQNRELARQPGEGPWPGEHRGLGRGMYHPGRLHASLDSLMLDSLFRQIQLEQDSILAIPVAHTPDEEEYGRLRLEEGQSRRYARWLIKSGYSPFSQNNLQFVFALIFFYMASIVVFFAEQSGKAEKRRREMEKEKASAELAYLKQQINPHFLFNTLNSIYSYTIGVSEEASDAVLKLSSILRYMLYETNRDQVPLADELAVLDNYIDLQRLRTTEKTEIEVLVQGDTHLHRIEPMLLIPIIENAFKYGVDSVESSFVKIEVDVKQSDFMFRVTNKVVRRNDGDRSHSGIGLTNIRRRLELIYGPGNYDLKAGEKNGIFSVTLRLKLRD